MRGGCIACHRSCRSELHSFLFERRGPLLSGWLRLVLLQLQRDVLQSRSRAVLFSGDHTVRDHVLPGKRGLPRRGLLSARQYRLLRWYLL